MDEDDEVILEGSSLYYHLKETGHEDFEVASIQHKHNYKEIYQIINKENSLQNSLKHFIDLGIRKNFNTFFGVCDLKKEVLHSLTLKLIKEKFLEEKDLLILENLSPSIQKLSSQMSEDDLGILTEDYSFPDISWNTLFSFSKLFYLPFAFVLILGIMITFIGIPVKSSLIYPFLFGATLIIIRCFQLYIQKIYLMKLKDLLSVTQNANQLSVKCLRYLIEMDILKRGLGQKNFNFESDFEESLCHSFLHLQTALISYFQSLRSDMVNLCDRFSDLHNIHILFNKRYEPLPCSVSEENPLVKAKEEKRKVSSVISAFWTEIFLLFEILESLTLFSKINSKKLNSLKQKSQLLEKTFNLCQNFWLVDDSNLKHLINLPKSYEKLKIDVAGAVDTLSVKCKLLTYYSVHLKEKLEHCNFQTLDNIPFHYVREICTDIKNNLLSCGASVDDILERTENLYSLKFNSSIIEKPVQDETENFNNLQPETVQNTVVTSNDIEPYVIQDEVFEAVIEGNQSQDLTLDMDKEWLQDLKQEKKIKKKQKDQCRRVLLEIQPILHNRRKMWEEREAKALSRMKNIGESSEYPESVLENDSGVSSPLEIPNDCFENEEIATPKVMSLYGTSVKSILAEEHTYDGYDSEEERLLVYRRVKKELDEDEEKRLENNADTEDENEEENIQSSYIEIKNHFNLPLKPLLENSEEFSVNNVSDQSSFQSNLSKPGCFSSKTNVPTDCGSFSCGESSDENETYINWSSCEFRNNKTIENDKMCFSGFSLPILNQETVKSSMLVEEVFGGLGEGESSSNESCSEEN